jgi:phosphoglycerate-specific signal transduction histidine kinase
VKEQDKQEVQALLKGAGHDIIQAARIANGGQPAPKDMADLMAAWGTIAKVIHQPRAAANKAYADAQLAMLAGLMEAAA